jgi:hypothetical protein
MRKKWFFIVPAAILGILLFSFIGGEVVMRLWNWLLPPLFGWQQISFWQSLGLLALCRILFGGFGHRGFGRSHVRGRIRERLAERWEKMTPEERERAQQRGWGRCGFGTFAHSGTMTDAAREHRANPTGGTAGQDMKG